MHPSCISAFWQPYFQQLNLANLRLLHKMWIEFKHHSGTSESIKMKSSI